MSVNANLITAVTNQNKPDESSPISQAEPINTQTPEQHQQEQEGRRIYLLKQDLPPDYEIRRTEPMLQVRGVIQKGDKCLAYNAYGDVMTLSPQDCKSYVGTGRVYKPDVISVPPDNHNPL